MENIFMEIMYDLKRVMLLRRIVIQQSSSKLGLFFGQLPVLKFVCQNPDCTQKEVAQELQVSPPNITTMVKRMVKAGLLEKNTDPKNLRCSRLTITPKGRENLARSTQLFDELDSQMFSGFTQEELCQLKNFTRRLAENVASEEYRNATHLSLALLLKKMETASKEAHTLCQNKEE